MTEVLVDEDGVAHAATMHWGSKNIWAFRYRRCDPNVGELGYGEYGQVTCLECIAIEKV